MHAWNGERTGLGPVQPRESGNFVLGLSRGACFSEIFPGLAVCRNRRRIGSPSPASTHFRNAHSLGAPSIFVPRHTFRSFWFFAGRFPAVIYRPIRPERPYYYRGTALFFDVTQSADVHFGN